MKPPRASTVLIGQVIVAARPDGLEMAESIGLHMGRVVTVGSRHEVGDAAAPGARVINAGGAAIIPGIHDFHLHLVGMARARRDVALDHARSPADVAAQIAATGTSDWITGRGWHEEALRGDLSAVEAATGGRPTLLGSHDGHSAWASAAALALAGITTISEDPPGGRIERDAGGAPTGILRETAMDRVSAIAERLAGAALSEALAETIAELAAFGITGATDAGDYTDRNGVGRWAALGDSFSRLADAAPDLDGRLRLTLNIPVDGIPAAARLGLVSGDSLPGTSTLRFGWAKEYSDGALGSRSAALFAPYSCGETGDLGILRVTLDELNATFAAARQAGIGLAVHAIGDRAAATVLDAFEQAPKRRAGAIHDRIEHAQLVRPVDRARFAAAGIVASVQPIHCPADRESVERCWAGRGAHAFAWRSLAAAGATLAFGSDAPVEAVDPWAGLYAAVHRRFVSDLAPAAHPEEGIDPVAALSAYTLAPARAMRRADEGHLRLGAHADLAVLDVDLDTLLAGDERLASVRSELTLVGGCEVHRS